MKTLIVVLLLLLSYTLAYMGLSHFWPNVFTGAD